MVHLTNNIKLVSVVIDKRLSMNHHVANLGSLFLSYSNRSSLSICKQQRHYQSNCQHAGQLSRGLPQLGIVRLIITELVQNGLAHVVARLTTTPTLQ